MEGKAAQEFGSPPMDLQAVERGCEPLPRGGGSSKQAPRESFKMNSPVTVPSKPRKIESDEERGPLPTGVASASS